MARVMVVDDTLFMRSLIKSILKNSGHTVVAEAKDGEEACHKYMLYRPDLVTMDITMHGMNGLDAVKRITDFDSKAKIIMISAMSQKNMVIRAVKNGAKHFIIKPITRDKVIQVINEIMNIKTEILPTIENNSDIRKSIEEMQKAINDLDKGLLNIEDEK